MARLTVENLDDLMESYLVAITEQNQNAAQKLAEMGGTQPDLKPISRRQY